MRDIPGSTVPITLLLVVFSSSAWAGVSPDFQQRFVDARARHEQADSDRQRYYALANLAKTGFEAGELDLAETSARRLLAEAESHRDDWNYGNAIHDGNLVLGRLALRRGDVEEARRRILAAGRTPGSPQLDTFGPNMALAEDLIERGERKVVVEYFQECATFWKHGRQRLASWIAIVEAGGKPDFGANSRF